MIIQENIVETWRGKPSEIPMPGFLQTRWVPAYEAPPVVLAELERAEKQAIGADPKFIRVWGNEFLLEFCFESGATKIKVNGKWVKGARPALHSFQLVEFVDHPFLKELNAMPHVPKVVKSIYLKEVRLQHLNAGSIWPMWEAKEKADIAWDAYRGLMDKKAKQEAADADGLAELPA